MGKSCKKVFGVLVYGLCVGLMLQVSYGEFKHSMSENRLSLLRETTKQNYLGLDDIEIVSEEVVTPHFPWLKPAAEGKLKTLYMPLLRGKGVSSARQRHVVECSQRMVIEYTYLPLLKRRANSTSV